MSSDLMERRAILVARADELLRRIEAGEAITVKESEAIDFKEESGRRGRNGELQPGEPTNNAAAAKLADEVCCLANTPGGGVLILGVEDRTKQVLGTELDSDWLRHQIYSGVDIAPAIEVRHVNGQRILLLLVAESPEPVQDTGDRIRWRVGEHCVPVDRSEWWIRREASGGFDTMARETTATLADVTAGSIAQTRRSVLDDAQNELAQDISDEALFRSLGALRSTSRLTQAAKLLFCAAGRPLITLTAFDVHGGNVVRSFEGSADKSLLEQLSDAEIWFDGMNRSTVLPEGFTERKIRDIPVRAVREAILNGLIHRDWQDRQPTEVTWIEFDSTLIVKSPGGFTGGITEANLLTNRHARYPALADLFRALRLVDKQGVGVDRMYQAMISLGHRPPHIRQAVGPHVVCTLIGGKPVVPILQLVQAIRPEARQADVRIAIILDALLLEPFLTLEAAQGKLQADELTTRVAMRAATSSTIEAAPLVRQYKDVWVLGRQAFNLAKRARAGIHEPRFLAYATTDRDVVGKVVRDWLSSHTHITSGDLVETTRVSRPTAGQILKDLEGDLLKGVGAGRAARYVLTHTAN